MSEQITYIVREINADTFTPVGMFKRLEGTKKFLLESSFLQGSKGNYSYMGTNPVKEIIGRGKETTVNNFVTNKTDTFPYDALTYMENHLPEIDCELPIPFNGGAVGYVAYEASDYYERGNATLEDPLDMPDYHFHVYDTIVIYEHRTEKAFILTLNLHNESQNEMEQRMNIIDEQLAKQMHIYEPETMDITFSPTTKKEAFIKQVKQAKEHIKNGEAEQIVLSQRLVAPFEGDAFSYYRKLRSANPSAYMFYLHFSHYIILGSSPESLVHTSGENVVTNPIAGTIRRGKTEKEDGMLAKQLLSDEKELAEHDMLVELSKRDLELVCDSDSIHVPVYQELVKYEHVMHLVSEAHGTLQENKTSLDSLRACLPAGTLSGSPKKRAMEIIRDIELTRRGFYGGGIGYVSFSKAINFAIAIRSLVIKEGYAHLQTGAGIVEGSDPEKEYIETIQKAKSLTDLTKTKRKEFIQ